LNASKPFSRWSRPAEIADFALQLPDFFLLGSEPLTDARLVALLGTLFVRANATLLSDPFS
jgi:hypothetical protein